MWFGTGRKDTNPGERALWGDLMGLGMVFPIAIATGFFLGRWLGTRLGWPRTGMAIGLVWGVATGFWELYKTTVRLNRMDPGPAPDPEGGQGRDAGRDDAAGPGDGHGGGDRGARR
jgi:hypothetical protein